MKSRVLALSWLLPVGLFALWLAVSVEASGEAGIQDLRIKIQDQQVLTTFRLVNAFDEDFRRRIESGLPTDLVFRFELERDRRSWFDQSVASGRLQVIAMFNAVTNEYLVNFKHDGNLIESRVVRDPDQLHQAMTELTDFPIFSIAGRDPDERLQLRVRAELGTRMLLAFIPRTLATEWARTDRFRIADLAR